MSESAKVLRLVCKNDKQFVTARVQLGVTCYAMGRRSDARKNWEEALSLDKKNRTAKMYLAMSAK